MRQIVCAFAVPTLICAATYETSHAAPIAPLTGIQARSANITLVYSHRYRIGIPWRLRSSATMLSATLNLPCVGHSKPVAWPV